MYPLRDEGLQSIVIIPVFLHSPSTARKMRLGTMGILVALLMSATSGSVEGGNEVSELGERLHRRRHSRGSNLRLTSRARRRELQRRRANAATAAEQTALSSDDELVTPYVLPAGEPLQLGDGFGEVPLSAEADQLEREQGRREARHRWQPASDDVTVCCPTVEERTRPLAGTRRDGTLALLDTTDGLQQVFYEISCRNHTGIEPHRLTGHLRKRHSVRCVQEYSYSQALYYVNGRRLLDYIRIRSGCRCELVAPPKRRSSCHHRRKRRRERVRDRRQRVRCNRERRRKKARRQSQSHASDVPA